VVRKVSKATFKAKACELFRQVESLGESVIVTDHGKPTIEIRRYTKAQSDPLAMLSAAIVKFEPETMAIPVAPPARSR